MPSSEIVLVCRYSWPVQSSQNQYHPSDRVDSRAIASQFFHENCQRTCQSVRLENFSSLRALVLNITAALDVVVVIILLLVAKLHSYLIL